MGSEMCIRDSGCPVSKNPACCFKDGVKSGWFHVLGFHSIPGCHYAARYLFCLAVSGGGIRRAAVSGDAGHRWHPVGAAADHRANPAAHQQTYPARLQSQRVCDGNQGNCRSPDRSGRPKRKAMAEPVRKKKTPEFSLSCSNSADFIAPRRTRQHYLGGNTFTAAENGLV